MEILTEFDELQEAMKRINLNESVMPYINGILVNDRAYNQVQKILNCPEMISAHKFLYNLDLDQLSEDEEVKIDKLYKLGVDRGFIDDDLTDWDAEDKPTDDAADANDANAAKDASATAVEKPVAGSLFKAKVPCWTVIYSAVSKDGAIKTGEAYSNAISASAAKADVKSKLSNVGYSNIAILAIESCEADEVAAEEVTVDATDEEEEVEENDMLRNRPHNGHIDDPAGVVNEEDDEESSDEGSDEEKSDDSSEEESDDSGDEGSDKEESSDEEESDDSGDDESDEEESSDDEEEESDEESSDDEGSNDKDDDSEDEEKSDEDKEESNDEKKEELTAQQKAQLKNEYKQTFKNALVKCGFDGSFNDLTLEEKVKFFTQLSKTWKKNEPSEFMTDKEIEQLNNVVVDAGEDEGSDKGNEPAEDEGSDEEEESSNEEEEKSDEEESDED